MYVLLKTNKGDIILELDAEKAPETVKNFVKYVEDGQYNGTIFHRVIKGFMAQGGGMDAQMQERKTRAPIMNEANNGLKNNKYTIAMARTSDPDSATAQFFINTNDNDFLNFKSQTTQGWGYAVFGKVISGQEVVDIIETVATTRKFPHDDVPVEPIVIEKAGVLENYKPAA
ncbi:MAG: peptidyl-prolyl cis-trans isomerase [Elusimicrobiota bacterium]|nr:peptidyl-prolyl cis-trans isomerase [Elusimicrobiota bacterium]